LVEVEVETRMWGRHWLLMEGAAAENVCEKTLDNLNQEQTHRRRRRGRRRRRRRRRQGFSFFCCTSWLFNEFYVIG
jgi:hypothetical protein